MCSISAASLVSSVGASPSVGSAASTSIGRGTEDKGSACEGVGPVAETAFIQTLRNAIAKAEQERDAALDERQLAHAEAIVLERQRDELTKQTTSQDFSLQKEAALRQLRVETAELMASYESELQGLQEELLRAAQDRQGLEDRLYRLQNSLRHAQERRRVNGSAGMQRSLSTPLPVLANVAPLVEPCSLSAVPAPSGGEEALRSPVAERFGSSQTPLSSLVSLQRPRTSSPFRSPQAPLGGTSPWCNAFLKHLRDEHSPSPNFIAQLRSRPSRSPVFGNGSSPSTSTPSCATGSRSPLQVRGSSPYRFSSATLPQQPAAFLIRYGSPVRQSGSVMESAETSSQHRSHFSFAFPPGQDTQSAELQAEAHMELSSACRPPLRTPKTGLAARHVVLASGQAARGPHVRAGAPC